jgi:large subunit ribosomal protein L9
VKIILTQEVSGLGAPGDVIEVKDGYGRNYLLPQGFAIRWSRGAEKQVTVIKRARSAREIRDLDHANEVKAQVEGLKVTMSVRAGDGGRLFGSVTPAEVVDAVKAAGGPTLDRRRVELPGHIKSIGAYDVKVKLHPEVTAKISLSVLRAAATH